MNDYMVHESSGPVAIRYRRIVMWIHWITASVIVAQVVVGFAFHRFLERGTPERMEMLAWHKTLGVVVLLLALFRLSIRLINAPPPYPSDYPKWRRFFAVWNHRLFYILLIALPLTGLAAVSGRAEGGWIPLQLGLNFPAIPGIAPENDFGDVHEVLVWVTLALVVLHVSAAFYNQFVDRGVVASRMWPFKSTRGS